MPATSILVATWEDGLFAIAGGERRHELAGQPVRGLQSDRQGGVLAVVGTHSLCRRSNNGTWSTIAKSDHPLACSVATEDAIFVGTEDANILRVAGDGAQQRLASFDSVPGRETWYAGSAVIDGKVVGPPLGLRSMSITCDGAVLLANVHVGGIPRSTDGGATWTPTIAVDSDVHQVCAHPMRPNIVIAAAAAGFCVSRDAGATWTIEQAGLHAHYCSAVAFSGDEMIVAASEGHFSQDGRIYHRAIDSNGPLRPFEGLPPSLQGIADTDNIATRDSRIAVVDGSGSLYLSTDKGEAWSRVAERLPYPSALYIC